MTTRTRNPYVRKVDCTVSAICVFTQAFTLIIGSLWLSTSVLWATSEHPSLGPAAWLWIIAGVGLFTGGGTALLRRIGARIKSHVTAGRPTVGIAAIGLAAEAALLVLSYQLAFVPML